MSEDTIAERRAFTGELWRSAEPVYEKILAHPFLRGIADGSLPREPFRYYILQDAVYLREYARALSLAAVRSHDEYAFALFNEHAANTVAVELSLHESLFKDLGITWEQADATGASPTTLAYNSFLLKTAALGDYTEALGALLPCYWVYWEVGNTLRDRGSPDPLYQKWIDTYAGEDFGALVATMLGLTDRVCEDLSASQEASVRRAFVTASRYEWMFWDAAWRLEGWPVE